MHHSAGRRRRVGSFDLQRIQFIRLQTRVLIRFDSS
jgi:hypothetical protein